jgi:hypothetical protein
MQTCRHQAVRWDGLPDHLVAYVYDVIIGKVGIEDSFMKTLEYLGPIDGIIENPTQEFLQIELRKDDKYWAQGGGDSGLYFQDSDTRLIFFKEGGHGIFIMDLNTDKAPYYADIEPEVVYHNVGGNSTPTPSCCYMNQTDAERIILHYAETGEYEDFENWKDIGELIPYNEDDF